jgi:excisionase family DNA binding protein
MNNDLHVDELLTDAEVRRLLAVSRTTLWRLRKEAGLPFGRAGRKYLYRKSEILQWIKDNRQRAVQVRLDI